MAYHGHVKKTTTNVQSGGVPTKEGCPQGGSYSNQFVAIIYIHTPIKWPVMKTDTQNGTT